MTAFQNFSLADLERACPKVGRDWIRKLLQRLKTEGKVKALGKGRYSRWRRVQSGILYGQWSIIGQKNTLLKMIDCDAYKKSAKNSRNYPLMAHYPESANSG